LSSLIADRFVADVDVVADVCGVIDVVAPCTVNDVVKYTLQCKLVTLSVLGDRGGGGALESRFLQR